MFPSRPSPGQSREGARSQRHLPACTRSDCERSKLTLEGVVARTRRDAKFRLEMAPEARTHRGILDYLHRVVNRDLLQTVAHEEVTRDMLLPVELLPE